MIPRHGCRALRLAIPHAAHSSPCRAFSQCHRLKLHNGSNPSSHAHSPHSPLTTTVRTLMRSLPHPLTVILSTRLSSTPHASPATPSGLLVSSFNTITLHPTPYVSFNIKLPSSTYSAISSSGTFTASAIWDFTVAKAFVHGEWKRYVGEEGKLKDGYAGGGVWWMRCAWERGMSAEVGDHIVVVGRVLEAGEYTGEKKSLAGVYVDGGYRRVEKLRKNASEESNKS